MIDFIKSDYILWWGGCFLVFAILLSLVISSRIYTDAIRIQEDVRKFSYDCIEQKGKVKRINSYIYTCEVNGQTISIYPSVKPEGSDYE